jgi:hypothetical protein
MKQSDALEYAGQANHMQLFYEFCKWEKAIGGPDVHLKNAGWLAKDSTLDMRLWMGGCYINTYNSPGGEVIWNNWHWKDVLTRPDEMQQWIIDNWKGIPTRRERKSVRIPKNMMTFFTYYVDWMLEVLSDEKSYTDSDYENPSIRYDMAWKDSQSSVKFLGRYSGMKLLEYHRVYCGFPIEMYDIRPVGGWSPRSMLTILYPEYVDNLMGNDSPENLEISNRLGIEVQATLKEMGVELDLFELQVLLCDYKQCYVGKRQFPGRSQDSELSYWNKVKAHFGESYQSRMFAGRLDMYPEEVLGEVQGWTGVREELGKVLREHGYMWSDLKYDYMLSKDNLGEPVERKLYCESY